jgi:hypothetical protein
MRIPSPGAIQAYAQILDLVPYLKGSAAPAKVMVTNFHQRSGRLHKEDRTLVGVGRAAPGVTIVLHSVKDAFKAQGARRGYDFVISIGLQDKGGISNEETRNSTLGVHRVKQAINKNRIQKRRQRATLGYPTVHSQGHRLSAVDARAGREALVKGINESPEFACHTFVSKASKKGVVHNSVIRLAPVEDEEVGELPPLHARADCKNKLFGDYAILA